jgi:uncharacterized protein YlxW (UPF0749 family)
MAITVDSIKSEKGCVLLVDGNGSEELLTIIVIGGQDNRFSLQIIAASVDDNIDLLTKDWEGKRLTENQATVLVKKVTEKWTKGGLPGARDTDPLQVVKAFQALINCEEVSITLK